MDGRNNCRMVGWSKERSDGCAEGQKDGWTDGLRRMDAAVLATEEGMKEGTKERTSEQIEVGMD